MFDNNKCAVNYYLDAAPGGGGPKIKSGNSENHWEFLKALSKQITSAIKYFIFPTSHSCVR